MNDQKMTQQISIISRKHFEVDAVKDVDRFDEECVVIKTIYGILNVEGKELRVSVLDVDKGVLSLDGQIDAVFFSSDQEKGKRGFLGGLLR